MSRKFTSTVTLATLNEWGRSPGSPLRLHVAFDGTSFFLGRNPDELRRILVPPAYQIVLQSLPRISPAAAVHHMSA